MKRTYKIAIIFIVFLFMLIVIGAGANLQRNDEEKTEPSNQENPASFIFLNVEVTPNLIELGESVEISVVAKNIGDLSGSHGVELKINDEKKDTKNVVLDGGESESVIFTYEPEEQGEHNVNIEGARGNFDVIVKLNSQALYQEFDENEIAAEAKYEDQIIYVEGEIDRIGRDLLNEAYIVLVGDGFIGGVQCFFSEENEQGLIQLAEGQSVTVKGRCDGYLFNVFVRECSIVS